MTHRAKDLIDTARDLQVINTPTPGLPEHIDVMQVAASIAPRDGGPATGILALNAAFRQQGLSAIVITTNADGDRGQLPHHRSGLVQQDGALVHYGNRSRPLRLKNSWQQARLIWKLAPRADVIHIHGVYLAHSLWAYLAARHFKIPYVVQPHGTLEPYQEREGRLRKHLFNRVVGNSVLQHAKFFVAASTAEALNLGRRVPSVPANVFPLGVSLPSPRAPSGLSQEQIGLISSVPVSRRVAFVGRLAQKKRPDILVDAWNKVDVEDAILVLAGPAEDWTHRELCQRLTLRRAGRVISLEQLDRAEVAWVLQQCGIFVLPSENENFGIAVAEAMASKCAVVTTNATAASEHVTNSECGVTLTNGTVKEVEAALTSMLHRPSETKRMGERARKYADERLSWHQTSLRLSHHYRRTEK